MSEPLRILSVYEGFFSGGARILHSDVLKGLQARGDYENTILTINESTYRECTDQPMQNDRCYKELTAAGIAISSLGRRATATPDFTPFTNAELDTYGGLADAADIIMTLKEHPLRLTNRLEIDRPIIPCLHRSDPENQGQAFSELRMAAALGSLSMIITCAEASKDAYVAERIDPSLLRVILNGIDLEKFRPSQNRRDSIRRELDIAAEAPMVLFGARYDFMKNVPLFLESARKYLEDQPASHVVMCGAGMANENPKLQEDIAGYFKGATALRDRMHLLGVREDMYALYAAADIVALTSSVGEAYPLCLIEGMACGAVAVSTDIGDTKDMLGKGRGIITPDDPTAIAQAWQQAYTDRAIFRAAIAETRDTFDRNTMIDKYEEALQDVYEQSVEQAVA
jgi:glycosyltransferase involved in cell wall biosynthesis